MALETRIVREASELERWHGAWRELLRRSASDEPTRSPLWLSAWWRVFGGVGRRELRAALFFDGERLVGVAPLLYRRAFHFSAIPFRRLELLGSGEPEADEICSDHLGLIAESGRETDVAEALASGLENGLFGAWDELVLTSLDGDDPTLAALERALAPTAVSLQRTITGECPYVSLPKAFDDYLVSLRSEHRYLVRRALRDVERWAGTDLTVHEVRRPEELAAGRRVLETLHGERWRARGKSGVFVSPRFREFHDEVMARLLAEGALDLFWISVRDRPIAVAYNLIWNRKVHFYQSGRSLDVPKGIRPGIVLHALAIRRAIEAGFREYDFLAGNSQYKRELATHSRPIAALRAVRARHRERARRAAERGIEQLRLLRR